MKFFEEPAAVNESPSKFDFNMVSGFEEVGHFDNGLVE